MIDDIEMARKRASQVLGKKIGDYERWTDTMNDLCREVERLQAEVKDYDRKIVDLLDKIHDLESDNNRLLAEVERLEKANDDAFQHWLALRQEKERLRKALTDVKRYENDPVTNRNRLLYIIGQIVDKALEGGEE